MIRRPPLPTRPDTRFPYTTLVRSTFIGVLPGIGALAAVSMLLPVKRRLRSREPDSTADPSQGNSEHGYRQPENHHEDQPAGSGNAERQQHRPRLRRSDRKSTRLNPVTNAHLVCRLLLEKKKK